MVFKAADFILVPVELHGVVVAYGNWLLEQGFEVEVEPYDLEYPNSPVFRAFRSLNQSFFYEVASAVNVERAEEWVKYGRASSSDTRYIVAVPDESSLSAKDLAKLKELGVGVDIIESAAVRTLCPPHDLSLVLEFPKLSKNLRVKLGPAIDLLSQGNWMEAFEDACLALESESREYLIKAILSGRVSFVSDTGKPIVHTDSDVARMTLGALAKAFANLVGPSQTESRIAQALDRINPRRVTVAHYKHEPGERADELRTQVGKDIIVIVNAMRMLMGE